MSKTLHRNLEAKLAALDGPEWDSSDEEDIVEPQATKKIVKKKSTESRKKSKEQAKKVKNADASRVIYMGHIPPAFEEPEILQFLSQFGKVTNVKLSRSKRTGNPRGYAFVEFAEMDVAAIVAETMSGYFLLGERRLVCHVVPQDKIHPELFHGAKGNLAQAQAGITSSDRLKILHAKQMQKVNATKSVEQLNKITKRLLSREKRKREQLKVMGIDYDFPGYTATAIIKVDKESSKKRKVSVDENEDKESTNVVKSPKAKKSKTPQKSASKRKATEDAAVEAEPVKAQEEEMEDAPVMTPKAKKGRTPKKSASKKAVVEAEPVKAQEEEIEDAPVKTPKAKKGRTPKKSASKKAVVEAEPVKAQDEEMEDAPVITPKAKKGRTPKKSASKKDNSAVVEAEPVKAQDEEMEDAPVKTPKAKKGRTPKKSASKKDNSAVVEAEPVKAQDEVVEETPKAKKGRTPKKSETEAKKSRAKPRTRRSVS